MKEDKKVIAIGKVGKSFNFKQQYKLNVGTDSAIVFLSLVARMNPTYDFYIVGPNDLKKLNKEEYEKLFPDRNMYSIFDYKPDAPEPYKGIYDNALNKGLKFDFGLFLMGVVTMMSIPKFLKKEDGSYCNLLQAAEKYGGPYVDFINRSKLPWYAVSEDARYITLNSKDLLNMPRLCLTQMAGTIQSGAHIQDENDIVIHHPHKWKYVPIEMKYCHIEKMFLNGVNPNFKDYIDIDRKLKSKKNHLIILSNGHGIVEINQPHKSDDRLNMYLQWINGLAGTAYQDTMIYGKWDEEITEKYSFIKNKMIPDLKEEISDAKYAFVYSVASGFVTIKPFEMITLGLIPFLHPDYDPKHILNFPNYLYVENEEDLIRKMTELDSDDRKYKALLNKCFELIKPEYLDGSFVNNQIFTTVAEDLGFEYKPKTKGVKNVIDRLNNFNSKNRNKTASKLF